MKKKILAVLVGCLFIGVSAYAAGDLQVNGSLGIGTAPLSTYKADTSAINKRGVRIIASQDQDGVVAADNVQGMTLTAETKGTATGYANGISLISKISSTASSIGAATGAQFTTSLASSSAGSSTVDTTTAGQFLTYLNSGIHNYTVTKGYGFDLLLADNTFNGQGHLTINNYKNININDAGNAYGALSVDTLSGIWIDKQTVGGTANYGIVLNGDGAAGSYGAAVVFGTGNNVRLYAKAGDLYVMDSANNETLIGPHDPETGEWIFFSKNVKTGKTVRVNMEKLVKAVEKLTGETFMVESLIQE